MWLLRLVNLSLSTNLLRLLTIAEEPRPAARQVTDNTVAFNRPGYGADSHVAAVNVDPPPVLAQAITRAR